MFWFHPDINSSFKAKCYLESTLGMGKGSTSLAVSLNWHHNYTQTLWHKCFFSLYSPPLYPRGLGSGQWPPSIGPLCFPMKDQLWKRTQITNTEVEMTKQGMNQQIYKNLQETYIRWLERQVYWQSKCSYSIPPILFFILIKQVIELSVKCFMSFLKDLFLSSFPYFSLPLPNPLFIAVAMVLAYVVNRRLCLWCSCTLWLQSSLECCVC